MNHPDPAPPGDAAPHADALSPLAPLRLPAFRMLWSAWLVANVCMWMNDVAAAWMMTSLTDTPIWVALVQTAATLPVFLLGLPSGALADMLNRQRYLLATQVWVAVVALVLCLLAFFGSLSPALLLALTFANGIGLAMRMPVFAAIVPDLVPRPQLAAALALNGVAMNTSRIVGPIAAGALIAGAGSAWVFLLNAVLSLLAAVTIARWRYQHKPDPLGRERLFSAMRVGMQYVGQSYHLKGVMLRTAIFFLHTSALLALLALIARRIEGGDAGTFTLLIASMGCGAIASSLFLPRLRLRHARDTLVLGSGILLSGAMLVVGNTTQEWIAALAMLVCGGAWITTANSLSVSAQMGLPAWVRARGMSILQMAVMGSSALGAALWGQVATLGSVPLGLSVAAVSGLACMALAHRLMPDLGFKDDLTPSHAFPPPIANAPPPSGRVMTTVEYRIDPARAAEFRALMNESRRSRLRHGALSWELLQDLNTPGRFVEVVVDESWIEHLRRFDRVTSADVALRQRKLAFHLGDTPPAVNRYLLESTV
ncbi:MFS transporter [Thauera sinica]|uniref:MFS transporter n=1 Tax=Thauera sinica TaxID=2665146 RepID=A0ABW1AXG8_9RHOO|nr:MFS transporter [Thauera sp. K11]ATE61193.1 arabinose ABC transporter permease [Thauera sp. K11]